MRNYSLVDQVRAQMRGKFVGWLVLLIPLLWSVPGGGGCQSAASDNACNAECDCAGKGNRVGAESDSAGKGNRVGAESDSAGNGKLDGVAPDGSGGAGVSDTTRPQGTECPPDDNPCTIKVFDPTTGMCRWKPDPMCREPIQNLVRIFRGAEVYYGMWTKDDQNNIYHPIQLPVGTHVKLKEELTPAAGDCCASLEGTDSPGMGICPPNPAAFRTAVWRFLNFRLTGAHTFSYSFEETGDGQVGKELFVITARGDPDCNGKFVTFKLSGQFTIPKFWYWTYHLLATPEEFVFVGEDGQKVSIPVAWAIQHFCDDCNPADVASAFRSRAEESYYVRFREAIHNLLKIYRGARRYYSVKKTAKNTPRCQVAKSDKPLLDKYPEVFPDYEPLMQALTPLEGSCCSDIGPDVNGNGLCDVNPDVFGVPSWSNVGFQPKGERGYVYLMKESAEKDGGFDFEAAAMLDPDCDGHPEKLVLFAHVADEGGSCVVKDGPVVVYFPFADASEAAVIRLENGGGVWQPNLCWETNACGSTTPDDFDVFYREPVENVTRIQHALGAWYANHCNFPDLPDWTPNVACPYVKGLEICEPDPTAWNSGFWAAIGYNMPARHRYQYDVDVSPLPDGAQLVTVKARNPAFYCPNYGGAYFARLGVATNSGDSCSIAWLEGWDLHCIGE